MEKKKCVKLPGKRWIVGFVIMGVIAVIVLTLTSVGNKGEKIEFITISEKDYPQEIAGEVIPEYRDLERALACVVDKKIYVIVTRGEKPASGYKVEISKMKLEKEKNKETLVVYAVFCDPAKDDSMSQVLTYPVEVAETRLERLPDEIELRVQYEE